MNKNIWCDKGIIHVIVLCSSLTEKTNYIKSMSLGGAMLWSIETDDFQGTCGEKYPLLKTLNAGLRGDVPVPPPVIPKPTEKPSQPQPPVTDAPQPPVPPPKDICKKTGFIRDEKDCSVFYHCQTVGGNANRFNCSSRLAFDPQINACNYKNLVEGCH